MLEGLGLLVLLDYLEMALVHFLLLILVYYQPVDGSKAEQGGPWSPLLSSPLDPLSIYKKIKETRKKY